MTQTVFVNTTRWNHWHHHYYFCDFKNYDIY